MVNLLQETLEVLRTFDRDFADVRWLGSRDGEYAVTDFLTITMLLNIEYDNGFGSQKIASDLVLVGDDWWLERHEYDGAESWEFKQTPIAKATSQSFERVKGECAVWATLEEIMQEEV